MTGWTDTLVYVALVVVGALLHRYGSPRPSGPSTPSVPAGPTNRPFLSLILGRLRAFLEGSASPAPPAPVVPPTPDPVPAPDPLRLREIEVAERLAAALEKSPLPRNPV